MLKLRVRLAALFGCPIYRVAEIVPASEVPLWDEYFSKEPWGFVAQDMISSKSTMHICASNSSLKPGVNYTDFMFSDRFDSLDLSQEEFEALSEKERAIYADKQVRQAQMVLN